MSRVRQEAVWVEGERVGIGLGIVEHLPDVGDDDGTLGEVVAIVDVILDETVRDSCVGQASQRHPTKGATERRTKRGDVVPAESFEEDGVDVWEVVAVLSSREVIVSNDGVDLSLGLSLDLRVESHSKEESVDRRHGLYK